MAKKQWVNLPSEDSGSIKRSNFVSEGVDSVDVMGREIALEAEFDKKDAGAMATLSIEWGGDNAKYEPEEFHLASDSFKQAAISADGKVRFKVELSAAGGDTFKFKVKDAKGTEKELPEIETHRKLFYQVIDMTTITGLSDFGFLESEFKKTKREIHLEQIDSKGTADHEWFFEDKESGYSKVYDLAKPKYNTEKDPFAFAIFWVDCLTNMEQRTLTSADGVSESDGIVLLELASGEQLWKDVDKSKKAANWNRMTAFIYKRKDGTEGTFPIPDGDIIPDYTNILIKTRNFPKGVTGKVKAKINVAAGFSGGWSFIKKNLIVIATRSWMDTKYKDPKKKAIVIHEAGHKVGMVPNGTKGLLAQSTLDKTNDPAKYKSHCNDKGCTMWWTTEFQKDKFCGVCDKSLRKLELYAPRLDGFKLFY